MKKNNGFTLIELLAVLVILALIALVTISAVSGTLKTYKNNLYENQIENIRSAARVWGSDNMLLLPNSTIEATCEYSNLNNCPNDYNKLIINLTDLQNGGYIGKDITNPRTKEKFENLEIVITKSGKKIEYEVIDQNYFPYKVGNSIYVKINDLEKKEFYVIENSSEKSKYVKAILAESLSNINGYWCDGCSTNINGPTTINGYLSDLGWTNVSEKRLMTKIEFENAKAVISNDADQSWLGGNYWINEPSGTLNAYYVNSSLNLVEDSISVVHDVRPVIRVSKLYIVNTD